MIKSKGSGEALDVIRDSHGFGLSAPPTLNGLKPLAFRLKIGQGPIASPHISKRLGASVRML